MTYLRHAFVNPLADQSGFSGTKPSDWNARFQYENFAGTGPAGTDAYVREVLTAARTYYVRTDGNDSNDGLANTAGRAFLTLQRAYNVICSTLDFGGQTVTIQVADGTYSAGINFASNWTGGGGLTIQGNTGTPANCVLSTGANDTFAANNVLTSAVVNVQGFKIVQTGSANTGFLLSSFSLFSVTAMEFGTGIGRHIWCLANGSYFFINNYTISGGAFEHVNVANGARFQSEGGTTTLTGTPNFSGQFLNASNNAICRFTATFSGSATGTRYVVSGGSAVDVNGAGTSYLPGNAAGSGGTTTGGGFYG